MTTALFAGAGIVALSSAAQAGLTDWSVTPLTTKVGKADFTLGGDAYGAIFANDQPDAPALDISGVTGALRLYPKLERVYDSGLVLGLHGAILAYHDRFTNDRYGGDVFEKIYGNVQMGLGTVELGMADGAGDKLAILGPVVDQHLSLDDPEMTFFRDPLTGRAFDETFTIATQVGSSLNYAKISYYSPRLFGVELAGSYTPSEGKDVLPFVSSGPHVSDRQQNIWEIAANYTDDFGPVSAGAYAAAAFAHNAAKTVGHEGLTDWGLGAAADWDATEDLKLSFGAAWRETNAYAFNLNNVFADGTTHAVHVSAMATYDSWLIGGELVEGSADGSLGAPTLGLHGYQASVGYVINTNVQLTAGWQQLRYARSAGFFYNGLPTIAMNAEYLHLDFHV